MKAKTVKHTEAVARNAQWAKLTPAQQLAYLDANGLGAAKQRAKLAKIRGEDK